MEVKRSGSQASTKGPSDWFTGTVRIDPLFQAPDPARVAGASVTFEPGARTAWHTHPLGQTLIITAGGGWAQREGVSIEEIRPGLRMLFGFQPVRSTGMVQHQQPYDPYCHSRKARWQSRRLVGESYRRAIQTVAIKCPLLAQSRHKLVRCTCLLSRGKADIGQFAR